MDESSCVTGNLLEHIRSALGSGLETLRYAIKLLLRDLLPALLGGTVGLLSRLESSVQSWLS